MQWKYQWVSWWANTNKLFVFRPKPKPQVVWHKTTIRFQREKLKAVKRSSQRVREGGELLEAKLAISSNAFAQRRSCEIVIFAFPNSLSRLPIRLKSFRVIKSRQCCRPACSEIFLSIGKPELVTARSQIAHVSTRVKPINDAAKHATKIVWSMLRLAACLLDWVIINNENK